MISRTRARTSSDCSQHIHSALARPNQTSCRIGSSDENSLRYCSRIFCVILGTAAPSFYSSMKVSYVSMNWSLCVIPIPQHPILYPPAVLFFVQYIFDLPFKTLRGNAAAQSIKAIKNKYHNFPCVLYKRTRHQSTASEKAHSDCREATLSHLQRYSKAGACVFTKKAKALPFV